MWVDNDRWRGVPFLMRTGKRMAGATQRVSVILREPTDAPFEVPRDGGVLTLSLAGNGAVDLSMVVKEPGAGLDLTVTDASIVLGDVAGADALAALRPADPRRADRRPVAVHPAGRPGQRLGRPGAGAAQPAAGAAVRRRAAGARRPPPSWPRRTGGCSGSNPGPARRHPRFRSARPDKEEAPDPAGSRVCTGMAR